MPYTGSEITFSDFVYLLSYGAYRPRAIPLVREWAPTIEQLIGPGEQINAGSEQEKGLLGIHRTIQGDSTMQAELYQLAMSLWH